MITLRHRSWSQRRGAGRRELRSHACIVNLGYHVPPALPPSSAASKDVKPTGSTGETRRMSTRAHQELHLVVAMLRHPREGFLSA